MKKTIFLLIVVGSLLLTSCGTQKFYVGETSGKTISHEKRKKVSLFWGLIPIGKKQHFPAVVDAKGYIIITRYNIFDLLVTDLTAGIINLKTVKFEAVK